MPARTRGRPLKFGRPTQVVALTLPIDVVDWLKGIHDDPAWAVVALYDRLAPDTRKAPKESPKVELARLHGQRSLIVVDPRAYRDLRDVAVIPMSAERAFLALEEGRNIADLELAIRDQTEDPRTPPAELKELRTLLREIRSMRRSRRYRFSTRSIIIVEGIRHRKGK